MPTRYVYVYNQLINQSIILWIISIIAGSILQQNPDFPPETNGCGSFGVQVYIFNAIDILLSQLPNSRIIFSIKSGRKNYYQMKVWRIAAISTTFVTTHVGLKETCVISSSSRAFMESAGVTQGAKRKVSLVYFTLLFIDDL